MKHRIYFAFLFCCCFFATYAQDCDPNLKTARNYKAKNDFKNAVEWYKKVLVDCGDYDGNVITELKECERKTTGKNAAFLLEQSIVECGKEGGTLVMELKKAPASWSVSQVPEWLEVSSVIVEEKRVEFNASVNPNAEIRIGTIQLTSDKGATQEFTVIQHEADEQLTVMSDILAFAGSGGQETVIINANFRWSYSTDANWLQLNRQDNALTVVCSPNDLVSKRNATITFSGKKASQTIQVMQFEGDTYLNVIGASDSAITFDAAGGKNNMLKVSCNDTWKVKNNCPWLKVTSSGDVLDIQCEANPWAERRAATFEVVTTYERQNKTISVEQRGAEPKIDKISLPSASGERSVNSVRPHFRSVFLKGNKGEMKVKLHSNVQNWEYRILSNDENWITAEASPKDSLLTLTLSDNNGLKIRESDIVFSAMGIQDTLNIRQNVRGYRGIWDDYFESSERTWKTTRFFVDIYGAESVGFRIGGLAKRWKCVEFSLMNFAVEYAYKEFYLNWEPIVRGYLPLSRKTQHWALFMGLGTSVNMFNVRVAKNIDPKQRFSYFDAANFLFELGAEFQWNEKDNLSSRIFYRYDGYHSLGISFDLYKWTKNYSLKK